MGSRNEKNKKKRDKSKEKKGAAAAGEASGHGIKVITDARFSSVHSDPRFQKVPKHQSKVPIDSRFDVMFSDKSFSSSSAPLDKRGKPKNQNSENPLRHYYRLEEEEEKEEEEEEEESKKGNGNHNIDEEGEESEDVDSKKLVRGSSDTESGSEPEPLNSLERDISSSTSDTDDEDEDYSEDEHSSQENIPVIEQETHRLAIVNMDWNQVKAVDLFVAMRSFLPKDGQILSLAVYPSEFGLKRMEEEAVHGPIGLFDSDNEQSDGDDEIDNEKLRAYEKSKLREGDESVFRCGWPAFWVVFRVMRRDQGDGVLLSEALRTLLNSDLSYYYAVVECDSSATADYLYKECDGLEFARSSNVLDLRFIPDSMEFKHPPREVATEAPPNYEGLNFVTAALQQSKIHLSWEEDEPQRAKTLKRKFNADQLADLELNEFLASDEGETDDDNDDENDNTVGDQTKKKPNKRDMYRALIQSGDGSDGNGEEDDKDMEVTFNTGLEDISKHIMEKKDKKSETVWEAYLRKKSEKKKARKNSSKYSSDDESSDSDQEAPEQPDDFFIEEPTVKKGAGGKSNQKEKQRQEMDKEQEASRAELELLLADDQGEDSLKGYNLKRKKAKGKKEKEVPAEDKIPTINYDDPRFSALFSSPLFALDPTDPQYKRSAAYARQSAQKQQKSGREEMVEKEQMKPPRQVQLPSDDTLPKKDEQLQPGVMSSKKEKHELSSLVRSIKKKSQQVQFPSNSKERRAHAV
ncbi:hypothetical protein HHK36_010355 [Tetracentron sinense]|uniref:NUC153 domain-containing protein n=1 Tax=Tetracentron sinense TaxID=13715 RepID=A0A834ZDV3_TETSI|nr:hypothetical protein HHK36_010355 [Tetracentron sinense]